MMKIFLAAVGASCVSCAAQVVYADGDFAAGTWAIEVFQQSGGGSVSAVTSATGLPGAARRVTSSVNAPAGSIVLGFHRFGTTLATRYEPTTQGPLESISMSIDARMVTGFGDGQGVSVGLKQGQIVYAAGGAVTGSSGSWVRLDFANLGADQFSRIDGQPGRPDFSAAGLPIRFGFVTSNATTGGAYTIVVDYDNFRVVASRPCKADFNADGGVDGSDVAAFFAAWEAGGVASDINQDGGVDGSDVEAFFGLWEAGGC